MHVWIVEMLIGKKWYPTTGCQINKEVGQVELRKWKKRNPHDKYRLQKYLPVNSTKLPW